MPVIVFVEMGLCLIMNNVILVIFLWIKSVWIVNYNVKNNVQRVLMENVFHVFQ